MTTSNFFMKEDNDGPCVFMEGQNPKRTLQIIRVATLIFFSYFISAQLFAQSACQSTFDQQPNDSFTTAVSISLDTDVTGLIEQTGDNDYYKFEITTTGTQIKLVLQNLPADYDMALYNGSRVQLLKSATVGTATENITYEYAPIGTYYVKVYGYASANNPALCYRLSVPLPKKSQSIAFASLPAVTTGTSFNLTATVNSGLPITYLSSNPSRATVVGNTVNVLKTGTVYLTALQPGDDQYASATPITRELTITQGKESQTITFASLAGAAVGTSFNLAATTSSGLPVTYTSSNPSMATVVGNTVNALKTGTITITASQPGNDQFAAAVSVSQTLTITKGSQTITFPNPGDKTFGAHFTLNATSTSGLPIMYSTTSPPNIVHLSMNFVTLMGTGTVRITAKQAGNADYNPASAEITFFVKPADPVIYWQGTNWIGTNNPKGNQWFKDGVPIPGATSSILAASPGTYTVQVTADGYSSPFSAPFVVRENNQTITFPELPVLQVGQSLQLNATASSGLPITYVCNPSLAIIDNSTGIITAVAEGNVGIAASQPGNELYNPASNVFGTLTVVKKFSQSITFQLGADSVVNVNNGPITLHATASSGLPVRFESVNQSVATVSDNILHLVGPGFTQIKAIQDGDTAYYKAITYQFMTVREETGSQEVAIAAFPNEVENELTVDVTQFSKQETTVAIYDLSGRKIDSKTGRGVFHFQTKDYQKGSYVLKATSGSRAVSKHLRKK